MLAGWKNLSAGADSPSSERPALGILAATVAGDVKIIVDLTHENPAQTHLLRTQLHADILDGANAVSHFQAPLYLSRENNLKI